MSLRVTQSEYAYLVGKLILQAYEMGYSVTLGDAYRDPRLHGAVGVKQGYGHPRSAHKQRLAIDLNLFKDGVFLGATEDHRPLGEWWEKQHKLARWGGRFKDGASIALFTGHMDAATWVAASTIALGIYSIADVVQKRNESL